MWTASARHQYRRSAGRYASDVTDVEFALIEPLPPPAKRGGRGRTTSLREVLNALLYLVVPPSLMATTKSLPELSQAMITARVRTGRSELVGVPILDLVTITSKK